MGLTLILGNQLHLEWLTAAPLQLDPSSRVLMVEDLGLASRFRYHKLRLLHCFVAMRAFREALRAAAIPVRYFELGDSIGLSLWERLEQELIQAAADGFDRELRIAELPDPGVQAELAAFCQERQVALVVLPSPAFLASASESRADFEEAAAVHENLLRAPAPAPESADRGRRQPQRWPLEFRCRQPPQAAQGLPRAALARGVAQRRGAGGARPDRDPLPAESRPAGGPAGAL